MPPNGRIGTGKRSSLCLIDIKEGVAAAASAGGAS
jgi:hypothetical protein